jgi:hypothetical protein
MKDQTRRCDSFVETCASARHIVLCRQGNIAALHRVVLCCDVRTTSRASRPPFSSCCLIILITPPLLLYGEEYRLLIMNISAQVELFVVEVHSALRGGTGAKTIARAFKAVLNSELGHSGPEIGAQAAAYAYQESSLAQLATGPTQKALRSGDGDSTSILPHKRMEKCKIAGADPCRSVPASKPRLRHGEGLNMGLSTGSSGRPPWPLRVCRLGKRAKRSWRGSG